jgi:hypothetical protein
MSMKKVTSRRISHAALVGVVLTLGLARSADADVTLGSSVGDGLAVSLTFTPAITLFSPSTYTAGPVVSATGSAPAPYANYPPTVFTYSVPLLTVSAVTVDAWSNVNGGPGVRTAHGDSNLTNLTLAPPIPIFSSLFTLTLTGFTSSADVTGDYGSLVPTGSTTLSGLSLGFGLPFFHFPSLIFGRGSPAPNTQLVPAALSGLGLSVLLNDQTVTGNGISFERMQVDAVHINFTNLNLGIGTLNGDIYLGRTEAMLSAVPSPEPSSSVPFVAGGLGLAVWRLRVAAKNRRPPPNRAG